MIAKMPFIFDVNLPKIDAGLKMPFTIRAILVIAFVILPRTPALPAAPRGPAAVPKSAPDSDALQPALKVFKTDAVFLKGFRFFTELVTLLIAEVDLPIKP